MCSLFRWPPGSAALLAAGMTAAAFTPIVISAPALPLLQLQLQLRGYLPDVGRDYWASIYSAPVQRNVITGFADGTFAG